MTEEHPQDAGDGYLPIAQHGLIGDLRSCALVGTDGTIDWFCAPRFDSPSVFGSLLDPDSGGHLREPLEPAQVVLEVHGLPGVEGDRPGAARVRWPGPQGLVQPVRDLIKAGIAPDEDRRRCAERCSGVEDHFAGAQVAKREIVFTFGDLFKIVNIKKTIAGFG